MIALVLTTKGDESAGTSKTTLIGKVLYLSTRFSAHLCQSLLFQFCQTGKNKLRTTAFQELCPPVYTMVATENHLSRICRSMTSSLRHIKLFRASMGAWMLKEAERSAKRNERCLKFTGR